jgi:hypothetical protein
LVEKGLSKFAVLMTGMEAREGGDAVILTQMHDPNAVIFRVRDKETGAIGMRREPVRTFETREVKIPVDRADVTVSGDERDGVIHGCQGRGNPREMEKDGG